jgi:hypothetical protein
LNSPKIDRVGLKIFNDMKKDVKETYKCEDQKQARTLENFKDVIDKIDNKIYCCPNVTVKKYFSQRGVNDY